MIRIKEEHRWLREFRERVGLDAVISDNRYGLWAEGLYSVLMTHQLGLRSSLGPGVDRWIQGWHYRLIGRFSACWVPDSPEGLGLAGELSHPGRMPSLPTRYVGVLSRMEAGMSDETIDLLIVLSGPEPQRTILEKMLLAQLREVSGNVVLVRGLPGGAVASNVQVYDHLPAAELNKLLLRAKLVVARAGYSTVMDLVRLKKKAILIPTPGQTEQEYLGVYLMEKRAALCIRQSGFSLRDALMRAEAFAYVMLPEAEDGLLGAAIDGLLEKINLSHPSI